MSARPLASLRPKGRSYTTILSLDGGGVRALIGARLLAELERRARKRVSELFDLIAGTASGGMVALALAKPGAQPGLPQYSAAEIVDFFKTEGPRIFQKRLGHRLWTLGGLIGPRYPAQGIERVLRDFFQERLMHEATSATLVTAYDMATAQPFLFKSYRAPGGGPAMPDDHRMWEAARATAAIPTYLPPFPLALPNDLGGQRCLVSGGLFANHPAACAMVDANRLFPGRPCLVVSLGTAKDEARMGYQRARKLGPLGWARPVLKAVFEGQSDVVDYQLGSLLPATYFRFQEQDVTVRMDDTSPDALRCLHQAADELIEKAAPEIARVSRLLTENVSEGRAA